MLNSVILSYITFVYFGAFVLYLLMMVMGKDFFGRLATIFSVAGLIAHSGAIVLRWVESYRMGMGHAPFSNLYESLIFFAWTIMLLYMLVEWRTRSRTMGAFVTPLAFLAMAYASYSPNVNSQIQPTQERDTALIFVSADNVLCRAAKLEGMIAEDPNAHNEENNSVQF